MYTFYRILRAKQERSTSGRWVTVEDRGTLSRTAPRHEQATGDNEANFFHARRSFARNSETGRRYCQRWVAPIAWDAENGRVVETAEPINIPMSSCGYRERFICNHAIQTALRTDGGHELLKVYAQTLSDDEKTVYSVDATWDITTQRWVG